MNTGAREAEIAQLSTLYGTPRQRHYALDISQTTYDLWSTAWRRRQCGEVVLFIHRGNGNLILHTKDFYPEGAFRVPSGGIRENESLLHAVYREAFEETGLQVVVERFLAVVQFNFRWQEHLLSLPSYLFLLRELGGKLEAQDTTERIAAFAEIAPTELESVARRLENVPPAWRDWGLFRAIPHRLAAELLQGSGHEDSEPFAP